MPKALTIAGIAGSSGKTLVALALMAALGRRGLTVQPFKVGPDYIDPSLHTVACRRPSVNLDGWMTPAEFVRSTFAHHAGDADVAIVEGVMGLFDGKSDAAGAGSTAEIAALLGSPVVLVVDAAAVGRTIAAVLAGVENFDPSLNFAGAVFNRVGGSAHLAVLTAAANAACRMPVLGGLPRRTDLELPGRHLGLAMGHEGVLSPGRLSALADWIEAGVRIDDLLARAKAIDLPAPSSRPPPTGSTPPLRVGLAHDAAFCFHYADNLRLLGQAGVQWIPFSPLADPAPPAGVSALVFGGGYPELHAAALAANASMRAAVRRLSADGLPVWAECGGLMYLAESLIAADGVEHPMCGVLPITTQMHGRRQALRYVELRPAEGHPFLPAGLTVRGHEFHYSRIARRAGAGDRPAYLVREPAAAGDGGELAGFVVGRTAASYAHLHLGSNPAAAAEIVARLRGGLR